MISRCRGFLHIDCAGTMIIEFPSRGKKIENLLEVFYDRNVTSNIPNPWDQASVSKIPRSVVTTYVFLSSYPGTMMIEFPSMGSSRSVM